MIITKVFNDFTVLSTLANTKGYLLVLKEFKNMILDFLRIIKN